MKNTIFFSLTIIFGVALAQYPNYRSPLNATHKSGFRDRFQVSTQTAATLTDKLNAKANEITQMRQELKTLLQTYSIDGIEDMFTIGRLMRMIPFTPQQNKTIRVPRNSSIGNEDDTNEAKFELPDSDQFHASTAVVSFEQGTELDSRIMSPLVGLAFYNDNGDERPIKNLTNKIRIKIPLIPMDPAIIPTKRFVCKYFDVSSRTFKTDGVSMDQQTPTHVYCNTSHLTQFCVFCEDIYHILSPRTTTLANPNQTTRVGTTVPRGKDCPFLTDCEPKPSAGVLFGPSTAILFFSLVLVLAEINYF